MRSTTPLVTLLALAPACYAEGHGQLSTRYGGGGGGLGFALADEHQDGELGMQLDSSRLPPVAGEPSAPMMISLAARYAHAVVPDGWLRVYARGAIGDEMCPTAMDVARADACAPTAADPQPLDVPHTSMAELGAGVAITAYQESKEGLGEIVSLSLGVVYSSLTTRERGRGDFTGVDLALSFVFDPFAIIDQPKH